MKHQVIYDDGHLKWIAIGRDTQKPDSIVDTNEYLIIVGDEAFMPDPGGIEIFPQVVTAVSEVTDLSTIKGFLCSHQDPDIMSSLPLWLSINPEAKIYLSWLWSGFVSHFGHEYAKNFSSVADEGQKIKIGDQDFLLIPAHHCHSPGNLHLFDPHSKILFSGDVGAALLPPEEDNLFVKDFEKHIHYMEKFHKRWMSSDESKKQWVRQVRKLEPQMMCPQHGSIFVGEDIHRFLNWFEDLELENVWHNKK